jgi:hypothetical protein
MCVAARAKLHENKQPKERVRDTRELEFDGTLNHHPPCER